MELKETILKRRSTRKFKPDRIDPQIITELLEAARLAPSGSNLQPWRFMAVTSDKMRAKLASSTLDFVCTAPLIMVCCADQTAIDAAVDRLMELKAAGAFTGTQLDKMPMADYKNRRDPTATQAYLSLNVAIAIEHMMLRAVELGLGGCWVFMFNQRKVKKILKLPDCLHVVALVPFGYPDQEPSVRPRLPLKNIFLGEV